MKQTHIHQAKTRHRLLLLALSDPPTSKRTRRAARVHKELILIFVRIEPVGATPAQHVDVKLVSLGHHEVHLGGGDGREALEEADAQRAVRDDLRERQRRSISIVPALDDLQVWRDGPQVVVRRLVSEIAQAQRLPDLAGREKLLEL